MEQVAFTVACFYFCTQIKKYFIQLHFKYPYEKNCTVRLL